jgi:hypothetical protein
MELIFSALFVMWRHRVMSSDFKPKSSKSAQRCAICLLSQAGVAGGASLLFAHSIASTAKADPIFSQVC